MMNVRIFSRTVYVFHTSQNKPFKFFSCMSKSLFHSASPPPPPLAVAISESADIQLKNGFLPISVKKVRRKKGEKMDEVSDLLLEMPSCRHHFYCGEVPVCLPHALFSTLITRKHRKLQYTPCQMQKIMLNSNKHNSKLNVRQRTIISLATVYEKLLYYHSMCRLQKVQEKSVILRYITVYPGRKSSK